MPFRRRFDCLWCGQTWEARAESDLEGWAALCPECLGKADENGDEILQKEEWEAAVGGGRLRDDAPKVGAKAPQVSARLLKAPAAVDLGAPKRTTVLIFGSWT